MNMKNFTNYYYKAKFYSKKAIFMVGLWTVLSTSYNFTSNKIQKTTNMIECYSPNPTVITFAHCKAAQSFAVTDNVINEVKSLW